MKIAQFRIIVALFLSTFFLHSVPISARQDGGIAGARLQELVRTVRKTFPALRARDIYHYGVLRQGQISDASLRFNTGTTYMVVAVGSDEAKDIDIEIYDGYGDLVTKDAKTDSHSTVTFTPENSGPYTVRIVMYETRSYRPAEFAFQVFYVR
jgi:hypothetical protein